LNYDLEIDFNSEKINILVNSVKLKMDPEFPQACYCRKELGSVLYTKYLNLKEEYPLWTSDQVLNYMRIRKGCCRLRFLNFVPNIGSGYEEYPTVRKAPIKKSFKEITPIIVSKIGRT
jgi:DNA-directed RNA polymerase subunit N (RpoN/RPB10)